MTCSFKTAMSVARHNSLTQNNTWVVEECDYEQFTARVPIPHRVGHVPGEKIPAIVGAYRLGRKVRGIA